jgi:Xaa-Pro dipeptidase
MSSTLFIPPANEVDMMWSVPPPTSQEARKTHDFENVEYCPSDFEDTIEKVVKELKGGLVHTLPTDPALWPKIRSGYTQRLRESAAKGVTLTDVYLLAALQQTRLEKDSDEIELIKRANAVSSRAHEVVMRVLGMAVKGKIGGQDARNRLLLPGEWLIEKEAEAEAIFVASCRREGYSSLILIVCYVLTAIYLTFEVQSIKHISPSSHLLHVPRRCTTVATTRNLHGVP